MGIALSLRAFWTILRLRDGLIQNLRLDLFLNEHLLEPSVFGFNLLHASHHGGIHAALLSPPFIENSRDDP
jgi:hypothetical protein